MVPGFLCQAYNVWQNYEPELDRPTVNQKILAAIKFGVSQNKVIWRLLNWTSPRL